MTLEEIQSDESRRLAEFPIAENTIYLAHAAELTEGSAKMSMSTVPLYQP